MLFISILEITRPKNNLDVIDTGNEPSSDSNEINEDEKYKSAKRKNRNMVKSENW